MFKTLRTRAHAPHTTPHHTTPHPTPPHPCSLLIYTPSSPPLWTISGSGAPQVRRRLAHVRRHAYSQHRFFCVLCAALCRLGALSPARGALASHFCCYMQHFLVSQTLLGQFGSKMGFSFRRGARPCTSPTRGARFDSQAAESGRRAARSIRKFCLPRCQNQRFAYARCSKTHRA